MIDDDDDMQTTKFEYTAPYVRRGEAYLLVFCLRHTPHFDRLRPFHKKMVHIY